MGIQHRWNLLRDTTTAATETAATRVDEFVVILGGSNSRPRDNDNENDNDKDTNNHDTPHRWRQQQKNTVRRLVQRQQERPSSNRTFRIPTTAALWTHDRKPSRVPKTSTTTMTTTAPQHHQNPIRNFLMVLSNKSNREKSNNNNNSTTKPPT